MNGTRDTIIETAFLLFLKKGFKAVTLTDLEKAVGMTKGTFYYHFLNKEEVLKEGVTRYYRMLNNRRAEEMSRVHSLREFVDLTIHNLESIGHYGAKRLDSDIPEILCLSLMVEVISLYPEFKQMVSDTKISWMSKLEGVILEAKREKEIRRGHVDFGKEFAEHKHWVDKLYRYASRCFLCFIIGALPV